MQITCPCCNARYPLDAALADTAARDSIATALKLPAPLGDLLLRYLALFTPAKQSLSWARVNKLLKELQAMIKAGEIERSGRTWIAPQTHWQTAIEQMLNQRAQLTLPLKNHAYLLEILVGMANTVEARAEAKQIEQLRKRWREGVQATASGKTVKSAADIVEAQRRKEWDRQLGIKTK